MINMRKFQVTVNGASYEVEVEETTASGAAASPAAQPAAPVAAAPAAPAPTPKAAPAPVKPAVAAGGTPVNAPMPGTILDVKVKPGDKVKAGQAVCVLEAMKMENEIPASKDGTILQVLVQKGASVEVGNPLVTIG